jgi:hypothetical protein
MVLDHHKSMSNLLNENEELKVKVEELTLLNAELASMTTKKDHGFERML